MNYPVPQARHLFSYKSKDQKKATPWLSQSFSWTKKAPLMSDFLSFIKKRNRLFSNFPFVKEIYLANSISFNALHKDSDIDLFVITEKQKIWTARLIMSLLMAFFHIKRNKKTEYKRFCLSFFIDEENIDIEHLLIDEKDIYFPYRIAHLVPLYQEHKTDAFFKKNIWIHRFLPNLPPKQNIFLGNDLVEGRGIFKNIIEFLLKGKIWIGLEIVIKKIWTKRIQDIKKKSPEIHHWIIVKEGILKFHYDKRKKYSDLFFS